MVGRSVRTAISESGGREGAGFVLVCLLGILLVAWGFYEVEAALGDLPPGLFATSP